MTTNSAVKFAGWLLDNVEGHFIGEHQLQHWLEDWISESDTPRAAKVEEAVAEAGSMPGTNGFTMACFKASDVPIGTKLYLHPLSQSLSDLRELMSGKEIYLMTNAHVKNEQKPLYRIEYNGIIDEKIIFTSQEME